jgi:hypothetical protein
MFGAQRQVALNATGALEAMLGEELLRVEVPPMADWLERDRGADHAVCRPACAPPSW